MLVLSHAQGHVMLKTLGVAMGTQFGEENGEWVLRVEGKIKCFELRFQLFRNISSRLPPVTFETKCANNRGI